MREITFLIAKLSAIEKRSLPPRANAYDTKAEIGRIFRSIGGDRAGGEERVHVSLERCRRGRRWRAEGNKTAEGRDGRNRRNLLVPEGARRARTDYPSIIWGWGGERAERKGEKRAKKWRARKSGNGARTRREDPKWTSFPAELGFSGPRFPLNAHATQRASLYPGVPRSIRFRRSKRCN